MFARLRNARPRFVLTRLTALLILALPALITSLPPLVDYPDHLTRFWLLSGGDRHAPLSGFYATDWLRTASNILMDVAAVAIARMTSASIAGHVILILSALLPPLGAALVSRNLYGRWSFWQILCGLIAWPLTLLTGFMSLSLAYGAAMICLWLDLKLVQSLRWRICRQTVQALTLLLIHPFGALFYAVLRLGAFLSADVRDFSALYRHGAWKTSALNLGLLIAPFVIALGLLGSRILLFGQGDSADLTLPKFYWYDPWPSQLSPDHIFEAFVGPLRSYALSVDLLFVALLWLPVLIAGFARRLSVHMGLAVTGLALFAFGVVCPQGVGDTSMVDVRLWTMSLFILPIAVFPRLDLNPRLRAALPALALLVLAGRSAWLLVVWRMRQSDAQAVQIALDAAPIGVRLMPLAIAPDDDDGAPLGRWVGDVSPTWTHLDALAVMRRQDYTPTIFAEAGKQPLKILAPFSANNEASGGLLATPDDLLHDHVQAAAYLPHWRQNFDFILLLNADQGKVPAIPGTRLVRDAGFARLYKMNP